MTSLLWRGVGDDGSEALVASSSAKGAARILGRTLGALRRVELVGVPSPDGGAWVAPSSLDRVSAEGATRLREGLFQALVERSASLHGVEVPAVLGPGQARRLVAARRACYWALRRAGWSYSEIGRAASRHHSTVISALDGFEPAPALARALADVVLHSTACPPGNPEFASSIVDTAD